MGLGDTTDNVVDVGDKLGDRTDMFPISLSVTVDDVSGTAGRAGISEFQGLDDVSCTPGRAGIGAFQGLGVARIICSNGENNSEMFSVSKAGLAGCSVSVSGFRSKAGCRVSVL